jgi:hypothetical protein
MVASSAPLFASGRGPERLAEAIVSTLGAFMEANAQSSVASLLSLDEGKRDRAAAWLSDKAWPSWPAGPGRSSKP